MQAQIPIKKFCCKNNVLQRNLLTHQNQIISNVSMELEKFWNDFISTSFDNVEFFKKRFRWIININNKFFKNSDDSSSNHQSRHKYISTERWALPPLLFSSLSECFPKKIRIISGFKYFPIDFDGKKNDIFTKKSLEKGVLLNPPFKFLSLFLAFFETICIQDNIHLFVIIPEKPSEKWFKYFTQKYGCLIYATKLSFLHKGNQHKGQAPTRTYVLCIKLKFKNIIIANNKLGFIINTRYVKEKLETAYKSDAEMEEKDINNEMDEMLIENGDTSIIDDSYYEYDNNEEEQIIDEQSRNERYDKYNLNKIDIIKEDKEEIKMDLQEDHDRT